MRKPKNKDFSDYLSRYRAMSTEEMLKLSEKYDPGEYREEAREAIEQVLEERAEEIKTLKKHQQEAETKRGATAQSQVNILIPVLFTLVLDVVWAFRMTRVGTSAFRTAVFFVVNMITPWIGVGWVMLCLVLLGVFVDKILSLMNVRDTGWKPNIWSRVWFRRWAWATGIVLLNSLIVMMTKPPGMQ